MEKPYENEHTRKIFNHEKKYQPYNELSNTFFISRKGLVYIQKTNWKDETACLRKPFKLKNSLDKADGCLEKTRQ